MMKKKVLITGICGRIGSVLYEGLRQRFDIRGFDRTLPDELISDFAVGDLCDFESVKAATKNMDTIIHLAGYASSRYPWHDILKNNIEGTYHVFEAARINGVKRVVFASTNQVQKGYGKKPVSWDAVPKPVSFYGVSKVTGEMIGHMYALEHGIQTVCIRIGSYDNPKGRNPLGKYLSKRDCIHLFERAILQEDVLFEIVYGISNNKDSVFDLEHTKQRLQYNPLDE